MGPTVDSLSWRFKNPSETGKHGSLSGRRCREYPQGLHREGFESSQQAFPRRPIGQGVLGAVAQQLRAAARLGGRMK